MRRPLAAVALTALLVGGAAGCGDDGGDEGSAEPSTTAAAEPGDAGTSSTAAGGGASSTSSTEADVSSTTTEPTELPGEPIDIYPYEGAVLSVVGVEASDTLNVRSGPGTDFDVVTELAPLSAEATATGQNRTVDDGSLWVEVEVGGTTGWVSGQYVAEAGATTDITADVPAVSGDTVVEVAEAVAAGRASSEEGPQPTVTVVDGPTEGDPAEVTVDVVGLGDDALKGERLRVVAAPATGATGYSLVSVEATALCARGVTDGLCA